MTWCITGMPTFRPGLRTRLFTLSFCITLPTMAYSLTLMEAAGQWLITYQTTRDVLKVAWDITSLLSGANEKREKNRENTEV